MSQHQWACTQCGETHDQCFEYAKECCAPEPLKVFACESCNTCYSDEYDADTCCGGQPSQRALEARGQQRIEGL